MEAAFPAFRACDIERALSQLSGAKLIRWTSQGHLITEAGIVMATGGRRMSFERVPSVSGSTPYAPRSA